MNQIFGVVQWFNHDRGFGFIAWEGEKDLFFHVTKHCQVEVDEHGQPRLGGETPAAQVPKEGNELVFEVGEGSKGPIAEKWVFAKDWEAVAEAGSDTVPEREKAPPPKVTVAESAKNAPPPEPVEETSVPEPVMRSRTEARSDLPEPAKPTAGKRRGGSKKRAGHEGKPKLRAEEPREPELKSGPVQAVLESAEGSLPEEDRVESRPFKPGLWSEPVAVNFSDEDMAALEAIKKQLPPDEEETDRPKVTRAESVDHPPPSGPTSSPVTNGRKKQLAGAHS